MRFIFKKVKDLVIVNNKSQQYPLVRFLLTLLLCPVIRHEICLAFIVVKKTSVKGIVKGIVSGTS